jgi:hypothetical protein
VLIAFIATVAAGSAQAGERMWTGFHDDPVFRFSPDRQDELTRARQQNATIVRTLVEWHVVAPTKPRSPRNPFDPAYQFDDLDELVRNAQVRGMEVLITLWGTPGWANGDKRPQFPPTKAKDFQNFAAAVASRYSGRRAGFPFVRFYGIWNESNLGLFLSPQFNAAGKIVSPAAYAKLAAAGIAGIRSTSPKALIAIGETSSTGRDKPKQGTGSDSVAPATFARLVARSAKGLKFDAWAQHPYPFPVNMKPGQKVRYPNVTLASLPQFEQDLDTWFGRKNIPIWITEYGHETRPGEPNGVPEGTQARYAKEAFAIATADPRVQMFVWFVFRDSSGSLWQSGLFRPSGAARPARATWSSSAKGVDVINGLARVKGGSKRPRLTVYLREFCANNPVGATVGTTIRVSNGSGILAAAQQAAPLGIDCTVSVRAPVTVAKGDSLTVEVEANTVVGAAATRTITLVGQ